MDKKAGESKIALAKSRPWSQLAPRGMKCMHPMIFGLAVATWCTAAIAGRIDQKLWLDATINGKRARLWFDSGSNGSFLWRTSVDRLGLHMVDARNDGRQVGTEAAQGLQGVTETCWLRLKGNKFQGHWGVYQLPPYISTDSDGVIGWWPLARNVMQIDGERSSLRFLDEVPKKALSWASFPIVTNLKTLQLAISSNVVVFVDTGSALGVSLPPARWQTWKAAHPDAEATTDASFLTGEGIIVREESWAGEISLGSLSLTEVPIVEATEKDVKDFGSRYAGTLGLAALRRLNLIIDGKHGVAYLQLKKTPPPAYSHNRLGAVFVPDGDRTDTLTARVARGTPAQEAGVCNGDKLVAVDGIKVDKWHPDSLRRFWRPAGTKVTLILERNGQTINAIVTLRDILHPTH